jgi:hypothetical protein
LDVDRRASQIIDQSIALLNPTNFATKTQSEHCQAKLIDTMSDSKYSTWLLKKMTMSTFKTAGNFFYQNCEYAVCLLQQVYP